MKKQLAIWKFIRESLSENIPVMLLYVLGSSGSSPGRQGFFMAVNQQGKIEGSLGGGIMEHKFVEMAKEQLSFTVGQSPGKIRKQVHDKSVGKNQSGMICSGEQTILIYRIAEKDNICLDNIITCLDQNKNGTLQFAPDGILFEDALPSTDFYFEQKNEEDWIYKEKIGYKNNLYIIGGGHCALALSGLMTSMDFHIQLFDTRQGLNTIERNNFAQEKKIINNYSGLSKLIPSGKNIYVVIMTFGYRSDDEAVRALMNKDFKYIGLLGSKKKIEKMFSEYRTEGISEELLHKIHSPIGIQIKSETPEEIAVSIAAEIIKVKNLEEN
jgi:xanthine dehydrogenase accessory factor